MGLMVRMRNPETKKIEVMSPQNALDMEQHAGWKRLGTVVVKDNYVGKPQELLDRVGRKSTAQASLDPSDPANSRTKPKTVKSVEEAEKDESDDLAADDDPDDDEGLEDEDAADEEKLADKM